MGLEEYVGALAEYAHLPIPSDPPKGRRSGRFLRSKAVTCAQASLMATEKRRNAPNG